MIPFHPFPHGTQEKRKADRLFKSVNVWLSVNTSSVYYPHNFVWNGQQELYFLPRDPFPGLPNIKNG